MENIKGSGAHEEIKKKQREAMKNRFENIKGTEFHEQIKRKQRETMKSRLENIKGTEFHEETKRKQRERKKNRLENIKGTEFHEEIKKKQREIMKNRFQSIRGTECHEKIKERQRNAKRCKVKNEEDRIKLFKNMIRDGPMYICVCCNRCLYKRSIILFSEDKYTYLDHILQNEIVQSFDGQIHICMTCHKNVKK